MMVYYNSEPNNNPTKAEASKLANYVAGDAVAVIGQSGVEGTTQDLHRWAMHAARQDQQRLHSINFYDDHSIEDLRRVIDAVDVVLDGTWIAGIHKQDGKKHIHIAEAGRYRDVDRDVGRIADLRDAIASATREDSAW